MKQYLKVGTEEKVNQDAIIALLEDDCGGGCDATWVDLDTGQHFTCHQLLTKLGCPDIIFEGLFESDGVTPVVPDADGVYQLINGDMYLFTFVGINDTTNQVTINSIGGGYPDTISFTPSADGIVFHALVDGEYTITFNLSFDNETCERTMDVCPITFETTTK